MNLTLLKDRTILMIVGNQYEELEVWSVRQSLELLGATVHFVAESKSTFRGKYGGFQGYPIKSDEIDLTFFEARAEAYDALILPGGIMPDALRRLDSVRELIAAFHKKEKLIAMICHGPQMAIDAKVLQGVQVTSSRGCEVDLENAGAIWFDDAVVVDKHFISSRAPKDIPVFCRAIAEWLIRTNS